MTGTVEFIQRIRYVEVPDEKGNLNVYAIPETVENVRELVRCKDCKHKTDINKCLMFSYRDGLENDWDDWFCADGERGD